MLVLIAPPLKLDTMSLKPSPKLFTGLGDQTGKDEASNSGISQYRGQNSHHERYSVPS